MGKNGKKKEKRALINEGEDSEMELFGFRSQTRWCVLCLIGYIFTLGFLKLVFYWKPQWDVWAQCTPCALEEADVILLRTTDVFQHYSKKKVTWINLTDATKALLEKQDHPVNSDESSFINRVIRKPQYKARYFQAQKIRYVWDILEQKFQKIGVLEEKYSCYDIHSKLGVGLSSQEQAIRKEICAPNRIEVDIIPIWKLLLKEALNPYLWFQTASISMLLSLGYSAFCFVIIAVNIISITLSVYNLRKHSVKLHNLVKSHYATSVTVYQKGGDCKEIESHTLVPGDVFLLPRKRLHLPCDAVLIDGSCIVEEGVLTGESVPVTKNPLPNINNGIPWKIHREEDHKKHVLFCGTELIQTKASNMGPAKAVVIKTGFNTAKGDLVKSILYSKPIDGDLYREAFRLLLCLVVVSISGLVYTVSVQIAFEVSASDTMILIMFMLINVIPPSLPAVLAVGNMYALKRLKNRRIFSISPQKISMGGRLNLVCFDKTGTLTEDGLDLWGIIPSQEQSFQEVHMFRPGSALPWGPVLGAMVSCHSLIWLDGKVQGDPMELKMFEGTDWAIENYGADGRDGEVSSGMIVKPGPKASKVPVEGFTIVHQFPFSSSLQRMSVITRVIGSQEFMAFMKGAPEMVIHFCRPETVPASFSRVLELYTMQGFRVIGLAHKTLAAKAGGEVEALSREEVESNLEFLGLLVMENKVKPETKPAMQELVEAKIKTVMVTGDSLQTAITVAKNSGMVSDRSKIILVEANGPEESTPASLIMCEQKDQSKGQVINDDYIATDGKSHPTFRLNDYHFAMSGKSYQMITQHFQSVLPKLLLNSVIFARMSPRQKTNLIEEFQKLNYFVGMCGDGSNDCGALRAAHAGISLSEHEASAASPFTSQIPNIQCVPDLIKQGRTALVSSFCIFRFIVICSLIGFNCDTILFWQNKILSDYQFATQDIVILYLTFLTISLNQACSKLAPSRPLRHLISLPLLVLMLVHYVCNLSIMVSVFVLVQQQPWYNATHFSRDCYEGNQENKTVFSNISMSINGTLENMTKVRSYEVTCFWFLTSFCNLITGFVVTKGLPFRKPLYTNYLHSLALIVQITVFLCLVFITKEAIHDVLEIVCTPTYWRTSLVIMLLVYFAVVWSAEKYMYDNQRLWIALKKYFNCKTKSKYKIVQAEIEKDPDWPPLNVAQYGEPISAELESKVSLLQSSV